MAVAANHNRRGICMCGAFTTGALLMCKRCANGIKAPMAAAIAGVATARTKGSRPLADWSPDEREILVRRYIDGWTTTQLARGSGVSAQAIFQFVKHRLGLPVRLVGQGKCDWKPWLSPTEAAEAVRKAREYKVRYDYAAHPKEWLDWS